MNYVIQVEPAHLNFSPAGFRYAAKDCFECFKQYKPEKFSLIQYFLLCRTIELSLKAIHLETLDREQVKREFSHNLVKSYEALPEEDRILSADQEEVLEVANELYKTQIKAFEYVRVGDAVQGYSHFPNLDELTTIARNAPATRTQGVPEVT